jgi:hypothetical protein
MTDDKIKLGVLWKNLSREGKKPYLSGRVQADNLEAAVQLLRDGGRFLILTNKKRPDKQDPDCEIFVVPEPARREESSASTPVTQSRAKSGGQQSGQRPRVGSPSRR